MADVFDVNKLGIRSVQYISTEFVLNPMSQLKERTEVRRIRDEPQPVLTEEETALLNEHAKPEWVPLKNAKGDYGLPSGKWYGAVVNGRGFYTQTPSAGVKKESTSRKKPKGKENDVA